MTGTGSLLLWTAAAFAALTCSIHVFAGGRFIARPLLEAGGMRPVPRYTNYFCWHLVTLTLALMAAGFAWSAWSGNPRLAVLPLAFAAGAFVLNLGVIARYRQSPLLMPQWALFAAVAVPGTLGLWVMGA